MIAGATGVAKSDVEELGKSRSCFLAAMGYQFRPSRFFQLGLVCLEGDTMPRSGEEKIISGSRVGQRRGQVAEEIRERCLRR